MVDIHSHILPWLDDGAADLAEALDMAAAASASGVEAVCATPHCNLPDLHPDYSGQEYRDVFLRTAQAIRDAHIDLKLYPGMEVYAAPNLPRRIADGEILTLNRSRYLLMEFSFDEDPDYVRSMLGLVREMGILPILAHAERYLFVQENPQIAYLLQTEGNLIQVNKGSIEGRFGREVQQAAQRLLRHGLVAVVASDAHGIDSRTPCMKRVQTLLGKEYAKEYADILLKENPRRICMNQPTYRFRARPFEER